MNTNNNVSILLMGEGYCDYYRHEGKTIPIYVYSKHPLHAGDYDYNYETGEFSSNPGAGWYSKSIALNYPVQTSNDIFQARFDSVNIVFNKESINTNDLQVFLKACVSCSSISVQWASDSNYIFQTNQGERKLHEALEETASFKNSTLYYRGQKQIIVKELKPLSRVARSIKFRVNAILTIDTLDEVKIHHIEVLPAGLIFTGGADQ